MKNRKNFNISFIFLLILFLLISTIIIISSILLVSKERILIFILSVFIYISLFVFVLTQNKRTKEQIAQIQETFEFYSTNLVSESGIGIIIFDLNMKVIWNSKLINERFSNKLIGNSFSVISEEMDKLISGEKSIVIFQKNQLYYSAKIFLSKHAILITDITTSYLANKYYENEKLVLGVASIDSYTDYQITLEEETLFKINSAVTKLFDFLVAHYGIIYKKHGVGKFLIIANKKTLFMMESCNFSFISRLRAPSKEIGIKISLSIGFGTGSSRYNEIEANARIALSQSTSRGGDQITIVSNNEKNRYYGGHTEALQNISRVKIKIFSKCLFEKMSSSATSKIIVAGHKDADLDAIGAALGIVALANAVKKEVYIANVTFDATTSFAINKWLKKANLLFIKPGKAKRICDSKTMVIIVDTSSYDRIEIPNVIKKARKENIFIFDHHRSDGEKQIEHKYENSYIDTASSSTCEIITEVIRFVSIRIKLPINYAKFMLSGIYLDTNQFQKTTSSRTFDAASWLQSKGAIAQEAINIIKPNEKESKIINEIKRSAEEVKPGFFLSIYNDELDAHIIAKAAEELLGISNRKASFVISKIPGKNQYRMSARSINVNVQIIAELLGGGGHYSAAAAITDEPLEIFKDNVIQAIVSVRDSESNNNKKP